MRVELIARRQPDLQGNRRDYHVYVGAQIVGRMYETHDLAEDDWFWGISSLTIDAEIGVLHGSAKGMDDAKAKLRHAFDLWMAWALEIKPIDLRYQRVLANLKAMGVRPAC